MRGGSHFGGLLENTGRKAGIEINHVNLYDEMEAFDALPREVRDAFNDSPFQYSAARTSAAVRRLGLDPGKRGGGGVVLSSLEQQVRKDFGSSIPAFRLRPRRRSTAPSRSVLQAIVERATSERKRDGENAGGGSQGQGA